MRNFQSLRRRTLRLAGFGLMLFVLWFTVPMFASDTVNSAPIEDLPPSWQLLDNHQSVCNDGRASSAFYRIQINGTWTSSVQVGLASLPANATFATYYAPIPPGSSDGQNTLAFVELRLGQRLPVGNYVTKMWAKDATQYQAVPVTLEVRTSCRY